MSTYMLIHGAWHGGWCWDKVRAYLEQAGHKVSAPDLPGHGEDKTPTTQVTLSAYVDRVCDALDREADEPVVLVGHSMGGIVISQVAERRPEKVAALVYLCAFLLRDGEALLPVAQTDEDSLILPNLVMAADGGSVTVKDEAIKQGFYADCPDADVARATSLLVPQAVAPFATPVALTPDRFGQVRRVYIECTGDRAIPIALQRRMQGALPCETVITMAASHSPFFSASKELAAHLMAV